MMSSQGEDSQEAAAAAVDSNLVKFGAENEITTPSSGDLHTSSFIHPALEHWNTAPVQTDNDVLGDHDLIFQRSKTEKREKFKHDLMLDKLSDSEKKKIIVNLVKIQNDGTVEVDVTQNERVASELLELDAGDMIPNDGEDITVHSYKTIRRLKIAILVVGTRGDVQPFLAMAKRLQEFGHYVRLATHTNFRKFVKSAGIDFYPLGGDPRVLAGYMARNKGFLPSSAGEIAVQRKQLKAIIDSLLPACTEPDLDTGTPFRAQAIIANPPSYAGRDLCCALPTNAIHSWLVDGGFIQDKGPLGSLFRNKNGVHVCEPAGSKTCASW